MHKPTPFLSLENLTLSQGADKVFPNTNWAVHSDEHWAIIGPNGSGKSTLMRGIIGQVPVADGRIIYHFASGTDTKPQKQIAYITFDTAAVHKEAQTFYQARWNTGVTEPGLTVSQALSERNIWQRNPYEIVDYPNPMPDFNTIRNDIIDQLNIEALLTRDIHHLSNGERRKVSIAQALMRQPKLLILDNVFEGLDKDYRLHLENHLKILTQSSVRIFMVTTDLEYVPASFNHILVIQDHRVVAQGLRETVRARLERIQTHEKLIIAPDLNNPALQTQVTPVKTLINMRNVTISYNGTHILHNVNWKVSCGERWALLGNNGAGKTTLLSLVMGDNPQAYANEIELFGKRRGSGESIWDIKRRIGWMAPELHRHYPPLSNCFDVVCSGWFDSVGLYRKCNQEQRRAAYAVMTDLGISALIHKQFRYISETEQRLVLLARALVKQPQLLILDEPCQGLDVQKRQFVYQILDNTSRWTESLILVTHQTHHLPQSITHILTLHEGQTISRGVRQP